MEFPRFSGHDGYEKWLVLLSKTVQHYSQLADGIIIIGAHPSTEGTLSLQPSITTTKKSYVSRLRHLTVTNINQLEEGRPFFEQYESDAKLVILEPYRIFCDKKCTLSDGRWSYFSDGQHLTSASTVFVQQRILALLQENNLVQTD